MPGEPPRTIRAAHGVVGGGVGTRRSTPGRRRIGGRQSRARSADMVVRWSENFTPTRPTACRQLEEVGAQGGFAAADVHVQVSTTCRRRHQRRRARRGIVRGGSPGHGAPAAAGFARVQDQRGRDPRQRHPARRPRCHGGRPRRPAPADGPATVRGGAPTCGTACTSPPTTRSSCTGGCTTAPACSTGDSFFHLSALGEPLPGLNLCGAGRVVCLVDPVGDVYACPFVQHDEFLAGTSARRVASPPCGGSRKLFGLLRAPTSAGACASCGSYDAARAAAWRKVLHRPPARRARSRMRARSRRHRTRRRPCARHPTGLRPLAPHDGRSRLTRPWPRVVRDGCRRPSAGRGSGCRSRCTARSVAAAEGPDAGRQPSRLRRARFAPHVVGGPHRPGDLATSVMGQSDLDAGVESRRRACRPCTPTVRWRWPRPRRRVASPWG